METTGKSGIALRRDVFVALEDEAHPAVPLSEQIAAVEDCIRSMRQSYTHSFGEDKGKITDPIAARDITRLEAALETLQKVAMGPQ
jgi:hypothetical protein